MVCARRVQLLRPFCFSFRFHPLHRLKPALITPLPPTHRRTSPAGAPAPNAARSHRLIPQPALLPRLWLPRAPGTCDGARTSFTLLSPGLPPPVCPPSGHPITPIGAIPQMRSSLVDSCSGGPRWQILHRSFLFSLRYRILPQSEPPWGCRFLPIIHGPDIVFAA